MTAISVTSAYGVGLLGLASISLVVVGAEPVAWQTVAGLALVGIAGSIAAGLCAQHWIVLTAPLGLAGLFLALAVMLATGDPGDGGPAAAAAISLVAVALAFALAMAAALGVVLSQYLANPSTSEESDNTH